jgi:hypothetical protein
MRGLYRGADGLVDLGDVFRVPRWQYWVLTMAIALVLLAFALVLVAAFQRD